MADFIGEPWKLPYSAEQIEGAVTNMIPTIGENKHWWVWDMEAQALVDTGVRAGEIGVRLVTVELTDVWSGNGPYTQIVTIENGTENSIVDLRPDSTTLDIMSASGTRALYVENDNGVFTAYALGTAPIGALRIQASVTEAGA